MSVPASILNQSGRFPPHRTVIDPRDLDALVRELTPQLLAVVRRYARDEDHAEDLLQESWIHILNRLDSYKPIGSIAGWAVTVTRNVCLSQLRKEAREARLEVPIEDVGDLPDETPDAEEPAVQRELRTALFAALDLLPDRERQAIFYRIIKERSTAEVAEILEVSQEAVNDLVQRGLNRMRRMKALASAVAAWMETVS